MNWARPEPCNRLKTPKRSQKRSKAPGAFAGVDLGRLKGGGGGMAGL